MYIMQVNFYQISDNPKKIVKNLGNPLIKQVSPYNDCSVSNPSLLLNYDSSIIANNNYFYIPEWNSYYFMNHDIRAISGGRMIVSGYEDVLMTNSDGILNLKAYVIRGESNRNKYLIDSIPMQVQRNCNTIVFPNNPFDFNYNDYPYSMQVIGGKAYGN